MGREQRQQARAHGEGGAVRPFVLVGVAGDDADFIGVVRQQRQGRRVADDVAVARGLVVEGQRSGQRPAAEGHAHHRRLGVQIVGHLEGDRLRILQRRRRQGLAVDGGKGHGRRLVIDGQADAEGVGCGLVARGIFGVGGEGVIAVGQGGQGAARQPVAVAARRH